MSSDSIRVRALLSSLQTAQRAALKKMLPKCSMPECETAKYPSALLSIFPKEESYSLLGHVAEMMLQSPVAEINVETLWAAVLRWYPAATTVSKAKILKSKTTEPFLEALRNTRTRMDAVVVGDLRYDTELSVDRLQGHPDAQTATQIFEMKLTGLLKKNWGDFLFQVFAYGALCDAATDLYLVLPLQETVWHASLAGWTQRATMKTFLTTAARQLLDASVERSTIPGQLLQLEYKIGHHVSKEKTLTATAEGLPVDRPYQIFLGSGMNSRMNLADADLAGARAAVERRGVRLYVHSQYIINLCATPGVKDDYGVALLEKNLRGAAAAGFKGVVVHVGKSTTLPLDVAMANMRANVLRALDSATPECPLLLETPAGQGTEMLTAYDDFVGFVRSFASDRLRICVDTCHVFAAGADPLDYLRRLTSEHPGLTTLVHFNDSSACCGSCVDRHAFIGTGDIGIDTMRSIADLCLSHSLPMLVE